MTKTRHDNDMTNHTIVDYTKNETEQSWSIEQGVVYDENQIGQQYDRLYRCGIHQKWN